MALHITREDLEARLAVFLATLTDCLRSIGQRAYPAVADELAAVIDWASADSDQIVEDLFDPPGEFNPGRHPDGRDGPYPFRRPLAPDEAQQVLREIEGP